MKARKEKQLFNGTEEFNYSDVENGIFVDEDAKKVCVTKTTSSVVICNQLKLSKVAIDQNGIVKAVCISCYNQNTETFIELPLYDIEYFNDCNILDTFSINNMLIRKQHKELLARYVEYLYMNYSQIKECEVIYTYSGLGFLSKRDFSVDTSKYYTSFITSKDSIKEGVIGENLRNLVSHKGNLNDINNFLITNINTSESKLALSLGLLGPISYLVESASNIDNRLVNISGMSSTGKTTAAKLALSLFTRPVKTQNGLYRNANGTTLSIQRNLPQGNGLTIVIDDFSAFASKNATQNENFIYSLESAFGRTSCDYKGGVITPKVRKGAILLTSESKISEMSFKEGALVRILELSNIKWTKNAEHAKRINYFCDKQYGLLGPKLMQIILNYSLEELNQKFESICNNIRDYLLSHHLFDKFSDRIIDEYALVLLAVSILEKYYVDNSLCEINNFGFESIFMLLMSQEEENFNFRNPYEYVYSKLIDFYVQNTKSFIHEVNGDEPDKNHIFGRMYINNNKNAIMALTYVGKKAFDRQYKIDLDDSFLMQEFENKGQVLANKNKTSLSERYQVCIVINKVKIKCIRFVMPEHIKNKLN